MNFQEYKIKVMGNKNFGKNPEKFPKLSGYLKKLSPKSQIELIAAVLKAGEGGLIMLHNELYFVPLKEANLTPHFLFELLELANEENLHTILTSPWIKQFKEDIFPEKYCWLFYFYNFPKAFAINVIEALKEKKPLKEFHSAIIPTAKKEEALEIKPLLIKVLSKWPTEGKSGFVLLQQLKNLNEVKSLLKDEEISKAFRAVEDRCDFGSIENLNIS